MRITLIQAPCWTIHQPPLAAAYLSAVLRVNGFDVKSYDLGIRLYDEVSDEHKHMFEMSNNSHWRHEFKKTREILGLDGEIEKWSEMILKEDPRIIGFSMYWTTTEVSLLLAEKIKTKDPSKIIIFGGPNCLKEDSAFDFINRPYVDIVVVREGEETLLETVKRIDEGQGLTGIDGTLIKKDGKVVDNGERKFIKDLDSMPFPDFSDFDVHSYAHFVSLPVLTSRGCIGRCAFCGEKNFWLGYRFRTAENIFEELKYQRNRYNKEDFYFVDSLINGNIKELSKLCDLIISNNLKVNWGGKARIDERMIPYLLKKMKKAGCEALDYGIESGSQKVVNDMCKDMNISIAARVIKDTNLAGVRANCFFIIGFPTETFWDFLCSVKFVIKNKRYIDKIFPGSTCGVPPGSYLSRYPDEFGIVLGEEFSLWTTKDGRNTLDFRKKRLELFKKLGSLKGVNMG